MEFSDGVRVRIRPHFWWPQGASGTIRPFPGLLQEVPHVREVGGMVIDSGGCTRPYQDTDGPRTMVWVVFDEPARDFEGAGPFGQGEVLSQYLEPAPPDDRYFPAQSVTLKDGSLLVKCLCFGIDCAERHAPGDPDYEFWRWLSAHADLFPEVNDRNVVRARAAFAKRAPAEAEQGASEDRPRD
jgi:hypothetical protein